MIMIYPPQGGMAFVVIRGVLKIYFKQQQYVRQSQRLIMDNEESIPPRTTEQAPPPTLAPSPQQS